MGHLQNVQISRFTKVLLKYCYRRYNEETDYLFITKVSISNFVNEKGNHLHKLQFQEK